MEKLAQFFVKRPTLFWSLMAGIILYGVLSYLRMPKLEDPAVPIKQVSVVTLYPGADATTVELDVAVPIEDALRTLPNVDKIKSDVTPGHAIISVEFVKELPLSEIEQHFDLVRRKVADVSLKLPQGAMEPIVVDDMMDVYGLLYAFYGDGYTSKELEKYAKLLRRELLTVPGVKRINIGGTRSEVINIEFTPEFIKSNGLIPTQLMLSLQSATGAVDAGRVRSGARRLTMEVTEGVKDIDDIKNILLSTPEGKKVRVGDVAKVTREYASPRTNSVYINNQSALTIAITLENTAIVPNVGKAVDAKLAEVMTRFPVGMETDKIFFQPDKVDEAMESFMLNLLESVLIVVFLLMFTMGWRSGVIIGFGLVLTVALSFPILSAAGTTLQRISLGAFIVAMGMLVDNSVVIMDGILSDRAKGLPENKYLYRIGKNTAMPLLGATIIAACTFLPIYITPGSTGEFAGDLFIVICVSLLASWILALIQVPFCSKFWLGPKKKSEKETEIYGNVLYRTIRKILQFIIGHRIVSIVGAVAILIISFIGMSRVRAVFFPDFDYKQFVVECYFPATDDADQVDERIRQLADSVSHMDKIDRVIVSTGGAPARYCFVRPMPTSGDNYAELIVDCKDYKTMQEMNHKVREKLRDIAPDAYIRTRKYNFSISSSHTVEVEFSGPDIQVLKELSQKAEDIMRNSKYVDAYSVQNNWNASSPNIQFAFSHADAQRAGVTRSDIGNAIQAATDGYPIGVINDGDNILSIRLTMRNSDGTNTTPLTSIPVWSTANINIDPSQMQGLLTGATVPDEIVSNMFRTTLLGNVVDSASLNYRDEYIFRYNGQRTIQAEADPDPFNPEATPQKVLADISEQLEAIPLPPGYSMRYVGENEISGEASDMLMGQLPIILMMIFIVLLLLFNNWKKIFVIIICFPFVMCGIVPLMLLTDTPFTFIAQIGCMGLIGMMVKNAIVLVDEINRLQTEEHVKPYNAVITATLSRVRPVMLASFTTILGMIPLLTDALYGSLAVTVIGGLFVGTIITLMLLPLFYSIFFKIKKDETI